MNLFECAEAVRPKRLIYKKDLLPIHNLKTVFREIRDFFAGNVTGITRDEKIAQNIMRLLFCKLFDEKNKSQEEVVDFSNRPNETNDEFASRINNIFYEVKKTYSDIFESDEEIEITSESLSYIVGKLENFYLIDADRDIIADAFEELIGTAFRGGEGQFFTPRNVVLMMIDMLKPAPGERIIDPACGSGGFLAYILRHFLSCGGSHYIAGLDKDLFLSKLTKIYLTLLGESEYHVFCENSLDLPSKWNETTSKYIQLGGFDVVLTNPPFGAKIPVIGEELLKQYELGHIWLKQKSFWHLTRQLREKQPPQILFIERIIQLLKEGGRAGIVLPEGVFGNPSDRYIWEYIKKYASVIGVVSLSQETFQPSTHTKTSVVFLEKKIKNRQNIFFAVADTVGHNKNGKEIYKTDSSGKKILDDETPLIAKNFELFLNNKLKEESHLGFITARDEINDNIYIPENYKPELKDNIHKLRSSKKYHLVQFGDLVENGIVQVRRGNEIGSQYYGTGNIPFIRTTDIVNWEIKFDTVKSVSEDVYEKYKTLQDLRVNDILFVNDGTFLIGRSSIITRHDVRAIIQSHLRKIRVLDTKQISPFYLFCLLNSNFVQQQIEIKTFTQATLSTLGNRIMELYLPFHTNKEKISEITKEVKAIIEQKAKIREKTLSIITQMIDV